jgi:hypothetical protein
VSDVFTVRIKLTVAARRELVAYVAGDWSNVSQRIAANTALRSAR